MVLIERGYRLRNGQQSKIWRSRSRTSTEIRFLQRRSIASGTKFNQSSLPKVLRKHPFLGKIAVCSLTGVGFCTLSNPPVLRAEAPHSSTTIEKNASIYIQHPARATHSDAKNSTKAYTAIAPDHNIPGEQPPPSQAKASAENDPKETNTWLNFTSKITNIQWSTIPDRIRDAVVPEWLRLFPSFMTKFQNELSMAPGSLAEEIWREANDPECNPEITWDANVRVSDDICADEKSFLALRKVHARRALAKYLDMKEYDIHPDDVPVIAMCGSGGGLRALVGGAGSYIASKEAGLFDCITYTAGVSGSCWLQTLYFSSMGKRDHSKIIRHLKNRLGVHLAYPPAAFNLVNSAPTNKFLLTSLVEKLKGSPDADFGTVDVYGMLLAGRLMIPKAELAVDADDLKLSTQQRYISDGEAPLPIYTAVRHEIPPIEKENLTTEEVKAKARKEAWFQWFEFTPYEFWCEEMGAGIPIWATGRNFENGKTVWRKNGMTLPEVRVPMLLGIWGSAFCATLSHYYKEIRPVMSGLAGFGGIDQIIAERDEDLIKVHPIDPAAIPNFAVGMQGLLPQSCPDSLFSTKYLQLMDAGMSNNLPIYPLLRPGRNVDVIIAFDNSADVKTDNWLKVVDGYARQRNISGWPIGAGWPPATETKEQTAEDLEKAQAKSEDDALSKVREAQKDDQTVQKNRPPGHEPGDLGYCNVWVGTTSERKASDEPPPSKLVEDDWDMVSHDDAGITVVYFPLLANDKVPGVDPKTSDYLSTWNFVYTPEQIDSVVQLARANYDEGAEQTKRTIMAVYERKKKLRLEREKQVKEWRRQKKMRSGIIKGRKLGEGDHGDHFS